MTETEVRTHTIDVLVSGQTYRVTVHDLDARPIRAIVNGNTYEVEIRPSAGKSPSATEGTMEASPAPASGPTPHSATHAPANGAHRNGAAALHINAPMPGNIVDILVEPGEMVRFGQDLCVLEAMKMKNRLRAPGAGKVRAVYTHVGHTVQHGTPLLVLDVEGGE